MNNSRRLISPVIFAITGLLLMLFPGCHTSHNNADKNPGADQCTFTNPIGKGQDPWVTRKDGWYYFIESKNGGIYVSRNKDLTDIKKNEKRVWSPPPKGWNHANIWAPELHFIDGKWYIYYAAADKAGSPFIHQRSGVLESKTNDPLGPYRDRGMLYTGDNISVPAGNKWAIDLTVTTINGKLYAIWSGWKENVNTDKTPQNLYIARMSNPWTISSDRSEISTPSTSWEQGPELNLEEGPEVLKHGQNIFIIYSTGDSWLTTYKLGQLKLKSPDSNPLKAGSWIKSGPVFTGTDEVYGVGHASFTTSPDGTENWIVYHSKTDTTPGWNRVINIKRFGWKKNGEPNFGTPPPPGKSMAVPSGQCQE